MLKINQKTILKPVTLSGIGLHSAVKSNITLLPADANHGIVFKRVDLNKNNIIEADYKNVSSAKLCTTLKNKFGCSVSTVEHLLAAIYITGIDNLLIEINNQEVPIMDGSSKDFVNSIKAAGSKDLYTKRNYLKINKKIEFIQNEKIISIEPNNESLTVDFELVYSNKLIGRQRSAIDFAQNDLEDIYNSRTFCLFEDIEKIKEVGLAKGGSLDNAIVVRDEEILNKGGLRNNKEFVNHKILDLVGDFLLSGYRILGNVKCIQGGHHLSNIFLKKIFEDSSNYSIIQGEDKTIEKRIFKTSVNKLAVNA
jgi:UDP-3-O-[3-hydroxymyristoyl] N-acetylglucosamine deacetylase